VANQLDLAAGLYAIGVIQTTRGATEAAAVSLGQALELREALLRSDPENVRYQADLALTRLAVGLLDWQAGRHAAAVPKLRQALEALEAAAGRQPDDPLLNQQLANNLTTVGGLYAQSGLWQEAVGYLSKAVPRIPTEHWQAYQLAHLLVLTRGPDGYRRLCPDLLERFGNDPRPGHGPPPAQARPLP